MPVTDLPRDEWDFPGLDNEEVSTFAFYYEFARSCERVRRLVIGGRRFVGSTVPIPEEGRLKMDEETFFETIRPLPALEFIEALCAVTDFPERPYQTCDKSRLRWFWRGRTTEEPLVVYDKSYFLVEPEAMEALEPSGSEMFKDPFRGTIGYGEASLVFLSINWGQPDKEILKDLKLLLEKNRPDKFKRLRHPQTRGLGNRILPFRKDTALGWLSIWRRKELQGITWDEYISLYHPHSNTAEGAAQRDNLLRELKRKKKNAEAVIDWFAGDEEALKRVRG